MKVSIASPFRRPKAERTHRSSVPAPQPPHAATVPLPEHTYLPTTAERMRAHAEACLGKVEDALTQIGELHDWIAFWRAEAADYRRAADLVERDAAGVPDAVLRPGPAMGRDELLNGWQPGTGPDDDDLLHGGHAWHPGTRPAVEPRPSQDGDTETLPVVRVPAEVIR